MRCRLSVEAKYRTGTYPSCGGDRPGCEEGASSISEYSGGGARPASRSEARWRKVSARVGGAGDRVRRGGGGGGGGGGGWFWGLQ